MKKGHVDVSRISTMIRAVGETPTESRMAEILQNASKNGGKVTFNDFMAIVRNLRNSNEKRPVLSDVEAAFRVFDPTSSGFLHHDELRRVLTTFGDKLSDKEADELIVAAEVDDQGRVDYEKLAKKLMS